jgi:RecA/RadA recombinase
MAKRDAGLVDLAQAANKKFGAGTLQLAGRQRPTRGPRLTTGSLSFDYATGGGLLLGGTSIFYGGESSGKTTAATRIAGLAQHLCANCYRRVPGGVKFPEVIDEETGEVSYGAPEGATCDCVRTGIVHPRAGQNEHKDDFAERMARYQENSYEEFRVAYIDVEGTFDEYWAERVGAVPGRFVLGRTATAEEAIDLHDEIIRTGSVDLIITDSIAMMTPSAEVEASSSEWQTGLHPRLVTKFARKATSARATIRSDFGRELTEIWINQWRKKIGVTYGDNTTMSGGEGQKFFASMIVRMWASAWERSGVDEDLKKEWHMEAATDVRMNFKTEKNKTARPQVTGAYRMGLVGETAAQVLDVDYILAQAEKHGLMRKDGNKWLLGDEAYKTKGEMVARLTEPAVRWEMRRTLVQRMLAAG